MDDRWIWVTRWEDFQTFQVKRGKPWTPPWIKQHVAQIDDFRYLELTDRQRALLHDLRMMFATTRGRLRRDAPTIARHRHRETRDADLEALNDAGLIEVCSGTVLEQKWNTFWNSSNLEEKRLEEDSSKAVTSTSTQPVDNSVENTNGHHPTHDRIPF